MLNLNKKMASKFLEISSGKELPRRGCEIIEVEPNIFMLKTKESYVGLLESLEMWLEKNYRMEESEYNDILWQRSSSMMQVLSECLSTEMNVA
jgi:hypothetical protein